MQDLKEILIAIGPRLAVDKGGLMNTAGHVQAAAGALQLNLCKAEPSNELATKALGDGERGRTAIKLHSPARQSGCWQARCSKKGMISQVGPKLVPHT